MPRHWWVDPGVNALGGTLTNGVELWFGAR